MADIANFIMAINKSFIKLFAFAQIKIINELQTLK